MKELLKIVEVLAFIYSAMCAFGFVICVVKGSAAKTQLSEHQARNAGVQHMNSLIASLVVGLVIHYVIK